MTHKYAYIVLLATLLFSITSCSKELERINQNPNSAEIAKPDYLLTAATKNIVDENQ